MSVRKMVCICLSLCSIGTILADDFYLHTPGNAGTGCPAGSASVLLAPDQKSFTLIFDSFIAQAGGDTGLQMDSKNCSISVPVHIPQGMKIKMKNVEFRGYVETPRGGSANLYVKYFIAGQSMPILSKTFGGKVDKEFVFENNLESFNLFDSCGGMNSNFRIDLRLRVIANSEMSPVFLSIDNFGSDNGVTFYFEKELCY